MLGMYSGEQLGKAIALAIERKGLSKKQVADDFGVKPPSIQDWIKRGTIGKDKLDKLMDYFSDVMTPIEFGVNRTYLAADHIKPYGVIGKEKTDNVIYIPVINRIPAGDLKAIVDDYERGQGFGELVPDVKVSGNAFALEIEGESMLPKFKTGDRVVIDPAITPRPGDYVAFKTIDELLFESSSFKQYRPRGMNDQGIEYFELVPLNENYPKLRSVQIQCQIIGTMVEHRSYR